MSIGKVRAYMMGPRVTLRLNYCCSVFRLWIESITSIIEISVSLAYLHLLELGRNKFLELIRLPTPQTFHSELTALFKRVFFSAYEFQQILKQSLVSKMEFTAVELLYKKSSNNVTARHRIVGWKLIIALFCYTISCPLCSWNTRCLHSGSTAVCTLKQKNFTIYLL